MAYLEADAEKILLDALGTTENAVNWTIEAIAELPVGDREYGYDPLVPYGVEPAGHVWLHSRCWEAWHAARKREAAAALKAMGVEADLQRNERWAGTWGGGPKKILRSTP
jgi:hypothetical protein